jgi:hypothetical protein
VVKSQCGGSLRELHSGKRSCYRGCVIVKTLIVPTIIKDNINWRRHRTACPNYREDWKVDDGLYRCICLLGTPPETHDEQDLCMKSRHRCWRLSKPSEDR